jgi:ATP-binding cassette subfamily F protein uup
MFNHARMAMIMSSSPVVESAVNTGGVTVLKCEGLCKAYVGAPQFEDISLNLARGQRVGLIGVNGAGKSTLLKCLSKNEPFDAGKVETASNANVIYVDQEPDWGEIMVYEALFEGTTMEAVTNRKYYSLLSNEEMDNDDFTRITDEMETCNGWDYQERGMTMAEKLNIPGEYMYRIVTSLSGGERKRVGLAAALLKQPDVLLLDEPTNHLDIDALDWLADFLRPGNRENKDLTVLLVTHDRFFLERVCSEIVELDRASLHRYPGNYGRYLELKAERIAAEDAEAQRAKTKLRRESEWMAKQPRARQAKSKAREAQFYDLRERARGREVEKAVVLATPEEKEKQKRLGGVVAEFKGAKYMLGDRTLLDDFTYSFRQRDRIGIVGSNGVGKSTFLKVLTGDLSLVGGSVRLGDTVRVGYYEQTGLNITAEQEQSTILKFVQEAVEKGIREKGNEPLKEAAPQFVVAAGGPVSRRKAVAGKEVGVSLALSTSTGSTAAAATAVSEREAMTLLKRFMFSSKRWYDRVGQLSGGERRRLQLLQVLARAPNVLLLDEPSNDLDLSTLSALEEYLTESFDGCLVVVSHDNFFVNRVAEHLFVFQGDGVVRDFQGSYTEYLEYRKDMLADAKSSASASAKAAKADVVTVMEAEGEKKSNVKAQKKVQEKKEEDLSHNDRKEFYKLEAQIAKFNQQIVDLEEKIANAGARGEGYMVLGEMQAEAERLKEHLGERELRWLELADK